MRSFPILDLLQDCRDPPLTPESLEELELALTMMLRLAAENGGQPPPRP